MFAIVNPFPNSAVNLSDINSMGLCNKRTIKNANTIVCGLISGGDGGILKILITALNQDAFVFQIP